jgi:hypothetical protein
MRSRGRGAQYALDHPLLYASTAPWPLATWAKVLTDDWRAFFGALVGTWLLLLVLWAPRWGLLRLREYELFGDGPRQEIDPEPPPFVL